MKLINDSGIECLEELLSCRIHSLVTDINLRCQFDDINSALEAKKKLNTLGISFRLESNTIYEIKQENLVEKLPNKYFTEERVWKTPRYLNLCSEMEHQHLSNCVHIGEMLIALERLTKEQATKYILDLQENILPELEERFQGKVLPFKAQFKWDRRLLEEFESLSE